MNFTAKDVQALREKTGCGMMDCKNALVECDGDMDKAVNFLREKGLASQAKKATRVAAEGAVVTFSENGVAAVVEANTETDFVASNDEFKTFTAKVAEIVAKQNPADVAELLTLKNEDGKTVEEMVQDIFLTFRENISVRRFARYEGVTSGYVHMGGSIGVLVKFNTTEEIAANAEFAAMGKAIAMQIAAQNPEYLSKADMSEEELANMKSFTIDSALNKPDSLPIPILNGLIDEVINDKKWSDEDISIYQGLDSKQKKNFVNFISKEALAILAEVAVSHKAEISDNKIFAGLVQGRLSKQLKEVCLLEQEFVMDASMSVGQYIAKTAKDLGGEISIAEYVRFEKGEGIEKREDNFADEVASMIG